MFKICIVEDEINTLNSIRKIIEDYCEAVVVAGIHTVSDAVSFLSKNKIDLLLLDINLPDGSGFDILESTTHSDFKIIFITAFEKYALQAIKVSAADYLVKPINPKELINAVNTVKNELENAEYRQIKLEALFANLHSSGSFRKLVLKTSERFNVLNINDIVRCESDGSYTEFYLSNSKKIMVSKPLKEYDELLSHSGFLRVHKSHLVNINYINSYEKRDGGYLVLNDLSKIPVSVRKRDYVIHVLENLL